MATLSKHGIELDRREYASFRIAVMSDGQIMRNYGQGWKLWKRVAKGVGPAEYAGQSRAKYDARHPIFHEYIKTLMDATDLEHRGQLHMLVSLMPSDPDGVWSEFNDNSQYSGASVDVGDCVKLCRLYGIAMTIPVSETAQEVA